MNVVNFNDKACERYRRLFDAYIDNELLVETNQDVLQHLSSCPACTRILDDRMRMKQMVREAVGAEEAPLELAAAVRDRIRTERRSFFAHDAARWMMAAAAVLVLAIGVGELKWGRIIDIGGSRVAFQNVSARVQAILRVGLIDHVHCAILFQQWKHAESFDQMKAKTGRSALGPEFIDLVPAIQSRVGADFKLVEGHRCMANHRRYIHLMLTGRNGALLSVVVTEKSNESFTQADAVAVMKASGVPIYRDHQGVLEIAGFESDRYLAYIVSNLDEKSNLSIASTLAPVVYDYLHRLEI